MDRKLVLINTKQTEKTDRDTHKIVDRNKQLSILQNSFYPASLVTSKSNKSNNDFFGKAKGGGGNNTEDLQSLEKTHKETLRKRSMRVLSHFLWVIHE